MNAQEYWNDKILGWEDARYSWRSYLNPGSWSVRSRLFTALDFLHPLCLSAREAKVFELGCGSGELAQRLLKYPNVRYEGWDISDVAIRKAQEKFQGTNYKFSAQDLQMAPTLPVADYTILLGVTDWISEEALRDLLTKINSPRVLVSYTENKTGLKNHLYNMYRLMKDQQPHQTTLYTEASFQNVYQACGWKLEKNLSTKAMSPGRLVWLKKNTST